MRPLHRYWATAALLAGLALGLEVALGPWWMAAVSGIVLLFVIGSWVMSAVLARRHRRRMARVDKTDLSDA